MEGNIASGTSEYICNRHPGQQANNQSNILTSQYVTSGGAPFSLDKFKFELSMDDLYFYIQVENTHTGLFYHKRLSVDDVTNITAGLFTSISDIYDTIQLAATKSDPNVSVTIDDDAKLTLFVKTKIGSKERLLNFDVPLEIENLKPLQVCERLLRKLRDNQDSEIPFNRELIKVVQKVIDHGFEKEEQLNKVLRRIEMLEAKLDN